jgi:hypothetical protein
MISAAWPFRGEKGDTYTKITSDTSERYIVPGYTGKFTNLTALIIANTSASVCKVTLRDSMGGNVRSVFQVPANNTVIAYFTGTREDSMEQLEKNKEWTVTCGSSVDSIEVTALFKSN